MECHLFCHNEVPTAVMFMTFFAAPWLGFARAWMRRRLHKDTCAHKH